MPWTIQDALAQHEVFLEDWLRRFQGALDDHAAKVAAPIHHRPTFRQQAEDMAGRARMFLPFVACRHGRDWQYCSVCRFELAWFSTLIF